MNLRIENLEKRFGDKLAVQIPSLQIASGEFFAFVGPSGCGKTTTLNLIAGLEEPSAGTLSLGERQLNDLPPHKRDVAFVFQSYALYPHRTVYQNLAFPLQMARVNRGRIDRRVREVAALLGITSLLGHRPAQLSGGERQRVALGRAMVREPQLFLFDEPLSNLDAPLRAQMRKEIKRLHQQLGTTFIYVTHDQEEALSLSDRIAVMQGGRVQQCASPREIYDQPANRFVAGFFGNPAMNFLDAEITRREGKVCAKLGGHQMDLPAAPVSLTGGHVVLGVRPEHIRLSRESDKGAWPAQISLVELRGSQTYLEIDLNGVKLSAVGSAERTDQPGQQVWVILPAHHVRFFDQETGASIHQKENETD